MNEFTPTAKAHATITHSQQDALRWLLYTVGCATTPTIMVEVGVFCGQTPRTLLPNLPNLHYIGVDPYLPWAEEPGYLTLSSARQQALKTMAEFTTRARLLEVPSATAATWIADGTVDLVFIDASHEYKEARREIEAWRTKVRAGGIVCGHDFKFQAGVEAAVIDLGLNQHYVSGQADVWWARV